MEDMIRDLGQKGFRLAHAHYYEKLQRICFGELEETIVCGMHNLHLVISRASFGELEGQIWVE